jgi:hypothetical protein
MLSAGSGGLVYFILNKIPVTTTAIYAQVANVKAVITKTIFLFPFKRNLSASAADNRPYRITFQRLS